MLSARVRFLLLLAGLAVTLLTATWLYMLGMHTIEEDPRTFWQAFEFAAETITTTGYGQDATWRSPWMVLFVVTLQFFGVTLVYMIVPIYLLPALEERFEARLPRRSKRLRGHVVIVRDGPAIESLLTELRNAGVPSLVLETDTDTARRLFESKQSMVYGPSISEALAHVHLHHARALIANGSDAENVNAILTARQSGFEGEILALVEEPRYAQPIRLAGASAVFTPKDLLAETLAARASRKIGPRVDGIEQLGPHVRLSEIRIAPDSPLAGRSLAESAIGSRTGTVVIGMWTHGRLLRLPTADATIHPHDVLIALGRSEDLETLATLAGGAGATKREGPLIVAGFGEVGSRLVALLHDAGEKTRVIDLQARPGVDAVGDVLEPETLTDDDLQRARGVVLALDNDTATLFATVVIKDRAPELTLIARVNKAENVDRIHRAGADFALSISQVSGQLLARRLLGREAVAIEPELEVVRITAHGLAGHHLEQAGIRERSGCSVVALERGARLIARLPEGLRFQDDDILYICGSSEATHRFQQHFGHNATP